MCDTLGVILEDRAFFAKNSDRSPNEAQVSEFHPARDPQETRLQATYLTIDQVAHTHACLLSRPAWMWGAEMGVNEHGVCIGNEAVFTKGAYSRTGLTGMDLLRLGLERGASAAEARDTILSLLEQHGQGGNCGYDHEFYYDNSFLILDRKELFVLETAGKQWVYKSFPRASISNRLTLGADGDRYSAGEELDFRKQYTDPLVTFFSGSKARWGQTCAALTQPVGILELFGTLRRHEDRVRNPLQQGSVASPCMHAGGWVGDHSTASLVVELDGEIKVWLTGSSTPCISLFKPWKFSAAFGPPIFPAGAEQADAYWQSRERFHRSVIGKVLPAAFYEERDYLEQSWLKASQALEEWEGLRQDALEAEKEFYTRWEARLGGESAGSWFFRRYWTQKNQKLGMARG